MVYVVLRGQLGNQLFQYAVASNIAKKLKTNVCLLELFEKNAIMDMVLDNRVCVGNKLEHLIAKIIIKIYEKFLLMLYFVKRIDNNSVDKYRYIVENKIINYLSFFGLYFFQSGYRELKIRNRKKILLYGFFQCEKYFKDDKTVLKKQFQLKSKSSAAKKLEKIIGQNNYVCCHIRMGDYYKNPIFGVCTHEYYQTAINRIIEMKPDVSFFVFSNEIEKVKETLDFHNRVVKYEKGNLKNTETLLCMSKCSDFIISNSSYSWWAQYLCDNKNKIVIAPDKWMNIEGPFNDIYLDGWVLLPIGEEYE